MRNDVYRLMVLAVACSLSCDEAYEILNQGFIDDFSKFYDGIPDGEAKPSVLDAMISFTMRELPIRTNVSGSVVYQLRSRRSNIVSTFIKSDISSMITQLASREIVLEMIRGFLRHENTMSSMYSKINSSRIQGVFTQFLDIFENNCAHAFQFEGSFKDFVMNCFIQFFYKGRKQDIWAYIRETDTARREVEMNVVQEKILKISKTDDLAIHDLLINISLVNDMLFRHSGQSDDARGVQYDIYYLILCELCRKRVDEINEKLGEPLLEFIDPYDRKENRIGIPPNKGIAAKINNARELIPRVFYYVRTGRLNTANLTDLRDQCFKLGKHDREGRNCVWEDVVDGGETSRYLDTRMAASNYQVFDQILKGVVSVNTLMTEIESRGQYLIDSYEPALFRDKEIIRYMDYLSSVPFINLIRTLQEEPMDYNRCGSDLLEFEHMVDEYAGSAVNNHTHIRENRYHVITHGFMRTPKLKQNSAPTTKFEVLRAIAQYLDSTPRSYRDYIRELRPFEVEKLAFSHWVQLRAGDVVAGRYNSLYSNIFVNENKEVAEYYLLGENGQSVTDSLDDLSWNVGTSFYEAIDFNGVYGVFVPLQQKFFFYGVDERMVPFLASWGEVLQSINQSRLNGQITVTVNKLDSPLRPVNFVHELATKFASSIGFSYEVGINNLLKTDVQSRLSKMNISGPHKKYVMQYFSWLDECAQIQHSFIEVLKTIMTEVLYLLYEGKDRRDMLQEFTYAKELFKGLMLGEFTTASLDWILNRIHEEEVLRTIDWTTVEPSFRKIDCTVLDYCFGVIDTAASGVYADLVDLVAGASTPSQKFLTIYNFIYTKLVFLRYLRDAFSLMLDAVPVDASTLVCELGQRFNVNTKLKEFYESPVTYGVRTDSMPYEQVKQDIWHARDICLGSFRTLVSELDQYFRNCEDEIAKLIDYNIAAQSNIRSRFSEWGDAFFYLSAYPSVPELAELRKRATVDTAGFFLLNGSYFKGKNNNIEYYVHRSGRMVIEINGKFEVASFNFEDDTDCKLYRKILERGFQNFGV